MPCVWVAFTISVLNKPGLLHRSFKKMFTKFTPKNQSHITYYNLNLQVLYYFVWKEKQSLRE